MRRKALLICGLSGLALAALGALTAHVTFGALPATGGVFVLKELKAAATVGLDRYGVPHIQAESREDAYAALGYASARDRLFQMDMLRRKAAGRLAEVFGADLVASDTWSRRMNLPALAAEILARLPPAQIAVLNAYAAGVNQAMDDAARAPLEFTLLGYPPERWRPVDSILVALNLADLSYTEDQERMASVMRQALPAAVVVFLTPETDCYTEALDGAPLDCAAGDLPVAELATLMREAASRRSAVVFQQAHAPRGSNGWAVSGRRTRDGRAILANDMHLTLEIPNIWAQADLTYGADRVEGLFVPGLPMIISGSNGHVAWGMTSVEGDFADLVRLRVDASNPEKIIDETGAPVSLRRRDERITVRGGAPITLTVRDAPWGPVTEPLLGEEVALRWSMLDPAATNLDLVEMDRARTVTDALPILRGAGTPPLNGLVADESGAIGWTLMGRIPKRRGFDGLYAEAWSASLNWEGFLSPEETPTLIDPPSGFLVNANQRMLPLSQFPRRLGHEYSGGYRAYAISRALDGRGVVDEREMAALQIDARAEPYDYYQRLAISALDGAADAPHARMKQVLQAWNGRADVDSEGLPLILEFRKAVVDAILSPLLARCKKLDEKFSYSWANVDAPIRRLIDSGRAELLPPPHRAWRSFLTAMLDEAAARLKRDHSGRDPPWGKANRVQIAHPLSALSPLVAWLLDMPKAPLAGCPQCIRFSYAEDGKSSGANARLVVAPGRERDALIQMAGGQSGQPGSPHYADQQADWVAGTAHGFRETAFVSQLALLPARGAGSRSGQP